MEWFKVKNVHKIDSPSLLIYPKRIQHNIRTLIRVVDNTPKRLCLHVKTHKMEEVIKMQLEAGIERFKCATISELEMTLRAGAKNVLIAYQMVGPKISRFISVVEKFPDAKIASLIDDWEIANQLNSAFAEKDLIASIYLDLNNGMNRTGLPLNEDTFSFVKKLTRLTNLQLKGVHVYDGHFRDSNLSQRKKGSDMAFRPIYALLDRIENELTLKMEVISGGSPSFSSAAMRKDVICSPGTVLLWDVGYSTIVPELNLQCAAILLTRIISKPAQGLVTVDLGHKSVGSENPIEKRVKFLNLDNYQVYKHSEEHLILKVTNWDNIKVGQVLYAIPYHVCPSVALHDEAHVIRNNEWADTWQVAARGRRI